MGSEEAVKVYFEQRGLEVKRYTKQEIKDIDGLNPDFRVLKNGELLFYCEVKEAEQDTTVQKKLDGIKSSSSIKVADDLKLSDPTFNKLTSHIHKARKQLESVNPDHKFPNIVAFYNSDPTQGILPLIGVVTGNIYCDDGSKDGIFKKYSEGRVKKDLESIDWIFWFDQDVRVKQVITTDNPNTEKMMSDLFLSGNEQIKIL